MVSPDCESGVKEKLNSFGLKGIYLSTAIKDGRVQQSSLSSWCCYSRNDWLKLNSKIVWAPIKSNETHNRTIYDHICHHWGSFSPSFSMVFTKKMPSKVFKTYINTMNMIYWQVNPKHRAQVDLCVLKTVLLKTCSNVQRKINTTPKSLKLVKEMHTNVAVLFSTAVC